MMEWAIGVGDVELGLEQFRGEILGGLWMSAQQTFGIATLAPDARARGRALPEEEALALAYAIDAAERRSSSRR